jgi:hypothetical protein
LSWQRGGGRAGGRFGPGTDDQRLQQPDFGPSTQVSFSILSFRVCDLSITVCITLINVAYELKTF